MPVMSLKKEDKCLRHLTKAYDAFDEGEMRRAADGYIGAVLEYHDPRDLSSTGELLFKAFETYSAMVEQDNPKNNEDDRKKLLKIGENAKYSVVFRSKAFKTLAVLQAKRGERGAAAECCRRLISLVDGVKDKDKKKLLGKKREYSKPTFRRVGDVLSNCRSNAKRILAALEGNDEDKEVMRDSQFKDLITSPTLLPKEDLPDLLPRLKAGGNACDYCGETVEDLDRTTLDTCSQCFMAYYCSSGCQKSAWKAGHNKACRHPKQIKVGDIMQMPSLVSLTGEPNQILLVKVVARDTTKATTKSSWLVELLVDENAGISGNLCVCASMLKHIRPAK